MGNQHPLFIVINGLLNLEQNFLLFYAVQTLVAPEFNFFTAKFHDQPSYHAQKFSQIFPKRLWRCVHLRDKRNTGLVPICAFLDSHLYIVAPNGHPVNLGKYHNKDDDMPRLSLWRENHSTDYKFFDRRISEMMTVGGTGVMVHKYLGADTSTNDGTDATKPAYQNQSELNIQDLLFIENRDRKYDTSVYSMRGMYQVQDQDFDLKQFGIFLATGTVFMTFHLNDMIETLGRRVISGDVLELMHLKDYDSLDQSVPVALKRFFVVSDAMRSAEGYSPTWWPHLWRVKLQPLVDSQEYKDILKNIAASSDPFEANANVSPVGSVISTYSKYLNINEAIIAQAEVELPKSGYDTSKFYTLPLDSKGEPGSDGRPDASSANVHVATGGVDASQAPLPPNKKIPGYLSGDGTAPNGLSVAMGLAFPANPKNGDFFLRLDYVPNRLFRFDSKRWVKVEDSVRTNLTPGAPDNLTGRNQYVNNTGTFTDLQGNTHPQRQSLSKALTPKADN